MNVTSVSVQRSIGATTLAVLLVIAAVNPLSAQVIVFDTFDTTAVGSIPSGWSNIATGANAQIHVTNNIAGAPTSPNVFQFANLNTNETFEYRRHFPQYSLNTVSNLVINFRLNVAVMPSDFSGGFRIGPANQPAAGEETFAIPRFTRGTAAGTYQVLNFGAGSLTNNLPLNTWHEYRLEIDPSPTNAQNGVVRWYLNNNHFFTQNFTVPSLSRTNINSLFVKETFPGFPPYPITTFYLDNVRIFAEIPEPSAALLVGAGAMVLLVRGRRGR